MYEYNNKIISNMNRSFPSGGYMSGSQPHCNRSGRFNVMNLETGSNGSQSDYVSSSSRSQSQDG